MQDLDFRYMVVDRIGSCVSEFHDINRAYRDLFHSWQEFHSRDFKLFKKNFFLINLKYLNIIDYELTDLVD